jgi:hypothetical protein
MILFFATDLLPAQTAESVRKRDADEGVRAPWRTCLGVYVREWLNGGTIGRRMIRPEAEE